MATFKRGLNAEDRVRTKMEHFGCRIQTNESLDHKHKLDFVITSFPDNPQFFALGVQVTSQLNNVDKVTEFLAIHEFSKITSKAVYIEMEDQLDLDEGGALAIFVSLAQFAMDRKFADTKITGVRVFSDFSYEYFNLKERIQNLRNAGLTPAVSQVLRRAQEEDEVVPAPVAAKLNEAYHQPVAAPTSPRVDVTAAAERLRNGLLKRPVLGVINAFYRGKGFGFIWSQGGETYYFHQTNIEDEELRKRLAKCSMEGKSTGLDDMTIEFEDSGLRGPESKYPEARRVRLTDGASAKK